MIQKGYGGSNSRAAFSYNGFKFDSTYEVKVAESLDTNNVLWEKSHKFCWHDTYNKLHHYTPDFYLPAYDIYLDPKNNYLIQKDTFKINQVMKENNIRVLILDKNHLTWDKIQELI